MIGPYEITDPRTLVCQLCDRKVPGRIRVELYGGALMVCEDCHDKLRANRSKPYAQIIDKFCMRGCGYHANVKMARMAVSERRPWLAYG